jgi:hypothetical protein
VLDGVGCVLCGVVCFEPEARPTMGACDGLRMKASVAWIVVLALTVIAKGEWLHRCGVAVVWDGFGDAGAWSTVCAVGEWVTTPPFGWGLALCQAGRACDGIGEHGGVGCALEAGTDGEAGGRGFGLRG